MAAGEQQRACGRLAVAAGCGAGPWPQATHGCGGVCQRGAHPTYTAAPAVSSRRSGSSRGRERCC